MYRQHIILDFEMNPVAKGDQAVRQHLQREIIEIGAVKLNAAYEVVDRFRCLVRPEWNPKIAAFITRLTGITTADVLKAAPFAQTIGAFTQWVGEQSARIYSWSGCDLSRLRSECAYKNVPFPKNLGRWVDFQAVYPRIMELPSYYKQMSLRKAAEQAGILMNARDAHSALYDAEIMAELVIPVLNGEYRKQVELYHRTVQYEAVSASIPLGDACGGILRRLLQQMQRAPEYAK